jgi:tetratricopeptide (TPR) repeat protein
MTKASAWTKPAIQIAAAGLGAAVAGPLGGTIGGWLGNALGHSATELVKKAAEQFGEKAGEKLLDTGTDLLLDQLKGAPASLESLYRDPLRLSLDSIRVHLNPGLSDSADWFVNWKTCLTAGMPLDLPALEPGELVSANLDHVFCRTMERLDAQGNAIRLRATSINLVERTLPQSLLAVLNLQLPELLNETFAALIVTPAYEQAWKQTSFTMLKGLQQDNKQILTGLAAANEKLDALGTDLQAVRANAEASAVKDQLLLITQTQLVQEIASKEDWRQKYLDLLASSGPTLQDFLARGDLAGAAQFTQQKIEKEKATQAQNYFDYGSVQELQFHFAAALDAYREAWKIKQDAKYGFRYGYIAQVQNHWSEAIVIYQTLVEMNVDPQKVAITLNNLAGLYRVTHREDQAEEAWGRALAIHRDLAKTDPEAQAPFIAAVLNNLGVLYAQSNRRKEAEDALTEALTIRRKLV